LHDVTTILFYLLHDGTTILFYLLHDVIIIGDVEYFYCFIQLSLNVDIKFSAHDAVLE
jgi:hypothetical protein